jgi:hypothetical protein
MEYSPGTAFLNLLPDSRLRQALQAPAFIKAPAAGLAMGERNLGIHQPRVLAEGARDGRRYPALDTTKDTTWHQ